MGFLSYAIGSFEDYKDNLTNSVLRYTDKSHIYNSFAYILYADEP